MSGEVSFREGWNNEAAFPSYDVRRSLVASVLSQTIQMTLQSNFEAGSTLIEIGSGAGALRHYGGKPMSDYSWVETDHNLRFLQLPRQAKLAQLMVAVPDLPFRDHSIDGIVGLGVVDTLSSYDLEGLATESHRTLRVGGSLVHLLDMSPDYDAEIKNAHARKLFPLPSTHPDDDRPAALDFVALKNLPRRISRLPINDSLRTVFGALVANPEKYVPHTNRTGILFMLGAIARQYGMVVESHESWIEYTGERWAQVFVKHGFSIISNGIVTVDGFADKATIPQTYKDKGVAAIKRREGVVSLLLDPNSDHDNIPISANTHVFVAQKT
jgi:SAM-dependent methyltransferase